MLRYFKFRTVLEEFEAHLAPVAGATIRGKAERKRYEDGEERFKLAVRGLDAADGAIAEIAVNGRVVATGEVRGGRVRVDWTSAERPVPAVAVGDVLEVRVGRDTCARGVFRAE